ncbi:hypothetical protein HGRIS_005007 [Hohenbuehelia grisea]|uniref:Uncharacterized protein n=1 Tax=Hohenbuehelia grisea TaxID=104357 RepID=A0ABR3JE50_9AGAR
MTSLLSCRRRVSKDQGTYAWENTPLRQDGGIRPRVRACLVRFFFWVDGRDVGFRHELAVARPRLDTQDTHPFSRKAANKVRVTCMTSWVSWMLFSGWRSTVRHAGGIVIGLSRGDERDEVR